MSEPLHKLTIQMVPADIATVRANIGVFSVTREKVLKQGELSGHILDLAGIELQNEFNETTRQYSELRLGQIVLTSAHGLKHRFDKLLFVTLLRFMEGNEENLKKSIKECLKRASDSEYESIIFPALGMKGHEYPPFFVAMATVQAVCEFRAENRETPLKTVYISLYNNTKANMRTFLQTVMAYLAGREGKTDVELKGVQTFKGLENSSD